MSSEAPKRILALDIATTTGFALGSVDLGPREIIVGSQNFTSRRKKTGETFGNFEAWLSTLLHRQAIDLCIFEAPILPGSTNISTTRRLQGLAAITEMICHNLEIHCAETSVGQIKKRLTGNGRAEKGQMIRCAKDIGFRVSDDHQADACGIYMEALAAIAPERLTDFDPLLGWAR